MIRMLEEFVALDEPNFWNHSICLVHELGVHLLTLVCGCCDADGEVGVGE